MRLVKFKYYLEGLERPIPMFGIWIERLKGYSDVNGETVLESGLPLPFFPSYETWRDMVISKKRCGRCWAITRHALDLSNHLAQRHGHLSPHMPQGPIAPRVSRFSAILAMILMASTLVGCQNKNEPLTKRPEPVLMQIVACCPGYIKPESQEKCTTLFINFAQTMEIDGILVTRTLNVSNCKTVDETPFWGYLD